MYIIKSIHKNFVKYEREHLHSTFESLFQKIIGMDPAVLSKIEQHIFSCEFCKILKSSFYQNSS